MKSLINRLNMQTIILDIDAPQQQPLILEHFPHHFTDDTTLEVEVRRGQSMNDLFQLLSKKNISVTGMRNKTNRLEELFIHLISENKKA